MPSDGVTPTGIRRCSTSTFRDFACVFGAFLLITILVIGAGCLLDHSFLEKDLVSTIFVLGIEIFFLALFSGLFICSKCKDSHTEESELPPLTTDQTQRKPSKTSWLISNLSKMFKLMSKHTPLSEPEQSALV